MGRPQTYNNFEVIYDPNGSYVLIELTQGQFGLCDLDDWFGKLDQYKWFSAWENHTKTYYIRTNFYIGKYKQKCLNIHRLIMNTNKPSVKVDHINSDTLDNRKTNLRLCNNSENCCNRKKSVKNKSGEKNIYWNKSFEKWIVQIAKDYNQIYLGSFNTLEEAIKVRDENLIKLHGVFAHV